jgi:antitoxin component of MazEF toxin-antitoxin module
VRTRLTRIGDDVALVLDETMLDQLGVDETSEVEVSASGNVLTITPAHDQPLDEILDELDERYGSVFKRLAE